MPTYASVDKPRPRSRDAAGLPAVTAERIVDEALALTREQGLENWTLRQLAGAVSAYPAVVYHHVGDREAVVAGVIERVVAEFTVPEPKQWRDWFEELLLDMRPVLRAAPGVARRLALYGPIVASARRVIDRGVRVLDAAGFGDESVLVCNVLLTQACQFVALEDDREHSPRLRAEAAAVFSSYRDREDLPGLAATGRFVYEMTQRPGGVEAYYDEFFAFAIARILDGVAARLTVLSGTGR
ncbi:TetR/AcrR family transcriptional regulator [Actinokineospora xionganensis]|uniref:TetR/AcrR family transcriptional regulator C-terminal domain-containing protein n=1 Tax=Actinokineospora xionganensis TaxID=2684470 RepID=A0ABR7LFU3_9PSEU|nr:TetR/AcrR family transcriptional regulator C-terminal domain-containing protein [Actinokineospora xionganensis]MBC6451520.1 TetR/AcrR family transcriptional regulator C-terminal domain-containing protein [Actinokineospora xionganensis]